MPIQRYRPNYAKLTGDQLAPWRNVPPAIVSDIMNRTQVMDGRIKPIQDGKSVCGQARTVDVMVGDNGAPHMLIGLMEPGEIMVINAGGFLGTAVWGGIMTRAAMQREIGGIVVVQRVENAATDIGREPGRGFDGELVKRHVIGAKRESFGQFHAPIIFRLIGACVDKIDRHAREMALRPLDSFYRFVCAVKAAEETQYVVAQALHAERNPINPGKGKLGEFGCFYRTGIGFQRYFDF